MSFFPKTGVVDTEGLREECIEGPSFASSRADRSQGRGSENAGAPVSRTACGESGRPAHSRDEDPFERHKRIRIRHSKDHLVRKVQGDSAVSRTGSSTDKQTWTARRVKEGFRQPGLVPPGR